MNILFVSYWGLNEGLTAATVLPHLQILAGFSHIKKIVLVTIERNTAYDKNALLEHPKIFHKPLISKRPLPNIVNKVYDFIDFPGKLKALCKKEQIDMIIARGAPPGALAMMVSRKTGIPFCVESFEPHADYMYESGTWKWYDPRYLFQKRWEKQQLGRATALMPVAENYRKVLLRKGVPAEKMDVIPCCVPLENFSFNPADRIEIRQQLGIGDKLAAIYTGKFGGIYYRDEAFLVFQHAFRFFDENFFLILLTPDNKQWIQSMIRKYALPADRVFFDLVPHQQVPSYLSAADFAFSLQSPKPSNLYLSPIKNAEYWANGLPILMTHGVGDDAGILEEENGGAVFGRADDSDGLEQGFAAIQKLLKEQGLRNRLFKLADKHRNFRIVKQVYQKWYGAKG